jgi:hypothetical protein
MAGDIFGRLTIPIQAGIENKATGRQTKLIWIEIGCSGENGCPLSRAFLLLLCPRFLLAI